MEEPAEGVIIKKKIKEIGLKISGFFTKSQILEKLELFSFGRFFVEDFFSNCWFSSMGTSLGSS